MSTTLEHAIARLRAGGVVAFPTETVYGLGARALDPDAVARVFALKRRPADNPLIVHVADEAMARTVVADWPDRAARLARQFWPGPLTLVLPRSRHLPPAVTAHADSVAVRCPDHPLALRLLRALDEPLVAPSANRSGAVSPTCAAHVRDTFSPEDVSVLDGGPCRIGIESTVLALHRAPPTILRPGAIGATQIAEVLGVPVCNAGGGGEGADGSPGRVGAHYQPRARVVLLETSAGPAPPPEVPDAAPTVVLAIAPPPWALPEATIVMPAAASEYAARLYAALREADAREPDHIVVILPSRAHDQTPADRALWEAIRERVGRAAAP